MDNENGRWRGRGHEYHSGGLTARACSSLELRARSKDLVFRVPIDEPAAVTAQGKFVSMEREGLPTMSKTEHYH